MSTSVGYVDGEDYQDSKNKAVHTLTKRHRRDSFNFVRNFMNRFVGKQTERREKIDQGLVKGGLTPTFQRRENTPEVTPGEISRNTQNATIDRSSSFDSTSRPLMTQPVSQVQLPQWDVTPGLLGIYNHGNTCFMNTIIQCLSNTDLFSDFFARKKYKEILHVKGIARLVGNSKGEVTEQLGCLLESLWSGEYTPEISNHFKSVISKHNVQYKGSSQHDAQEFLLWLLDRINEELHNSPKKKAKESLLKSKKEKQSDLSTVTSPEMVLTMSSGFEVYNRFQALCQSSLTCPHCDKQSNTYEAYLCLSLPVPQKSLRPVYITVVYLDDSPKQLKIALELNVLDTIKELREKLAYELDVPPKRLVLCQVYDDGFRNTYGDDQPLSDVHESDTVYVFETYPLSEVNRVRSSYEILQILIIHVEKISTTKCYRFCSPQVIRIPRDIDFITLQKYILKSMGLAVSEEVVEDSHKFDRAIFDIRVIDSGVSDCYLPTDVDMPLYTQAIDRAVSTYIDCEDFGPAHVKFVIEWDPKMKRSIVDNDEDLYDEHQSVHKVRLSQQQPAHVSLDECLNLYTKKEVLGKEDSWNCPLCHKERQGTIKRLGLWSAPDILVIHLKRFRHSGLRRTKLNILVNFPITDLEMGDHLLPRTADNQDSAPSSQMSDLYDLYGVSNHYGNMNGGHYTAFCKNPINGQWYEFDDMHVKPLQQKEVVSRAAYLLFYQRKKLTNSTVDALHSRNHWIFNVYGLPRSPSAMTSPVYEDGNAYECDMVGGQTNRDRLGSVSDRTQDFVQPRGKSDTYKSRGVDENDSLEYLRREINSPRRDDRPLTVEINFPRQQARKKTRESPRKELYVNLDQASGRNKSYTNDVGAQKPSEKGSIADQIIRSTAAFSQNQVDGQRPSQDQVDGQRLTPKTSESNREARTNNRGPDSLDSCKNSHSYTSSSEINQGESSPQSSPLDEFIRSNPPSPNDQNTTDNKKNDNIQGNMLNNERTLSGNSSYISNNVKLKIHSNQIHKDSASSKTSKNESRLQSNVQPAKTYNQKITNTISNVNRDSKPNSTLRKDMFSTPQQPRKSPSPPLMNGRGQWSTPQPQRKHYSNYSDSRPPMDRQLSAPSKAKTSWSYDAQNIPDFEIKGHGLLDEQSQSLPVRTSADKPPLPKPSQSSSRQTNIRPSTAHGGSRVPAYSDNIVSNISEYQTVSGTGLHAVGEREPDRYDTEVGRAPNPAWVDVRERNKTDVRQTDTSRRSMRVQPERPRSYHQSSHNDYYNQYYLQQPTGSSMTATNFDRANKYATMRPARAAHSHYSDEESQYLADQQYTADINQMHQPRSRAPLAYNPTRYQDRSSTDMPRYQPHLHEAKHFSRVALAIQEREMQKRMKSQCLKESSV